MAINFSWLRSVCFTLRCLISWIHFIHCLSVREPAYFQYKISTCAVCSIRTYLRRMRSPLCKLCTSNEILSAVVIISSSFLLNFPFYLLAKLATSEFRCSLAGNLLGMEFNIFHKNMHIYLRHIRSMQFYLSHIRFACIVLKVGRSVFSG